jgi:hypothetical protein
MFNIIKNVLNINNDSVEEKSEIHHSNILCICEKCHTDQSEYIINETEVLTSESTIKTFIKSKISNQLDLTRSKTILSSENLCLKCEISEYPDRFHGCAFCRRPLRNIFACSTCRIGFTEWIKDIIQPDNVILSGIRNQAKNIVKRIIQSGFIENREFIYRERQMMFEWPGFYIGMTNITKDGESKFYLPTWIVPDNLIINSNIKSLSIGNDLSNLTKFKVFEKRLITILEENNIYLFSNVQIDLREFDKSNIKKINSYNTDIFV